MTTKKGNEELDKLILQAQITLAGMYAGLAKAGVNETAARRISELELARAFRA